MNIRERPDRTELNRKVIALPRVVGGVDPGAVTTEVSLKSILIPRDSIRVEDAFTINSHGFHICNANTVTYRLRFGGTLLVTFTFTVNETARWYLVGDMGRTAAGTLQFGFAYMKDGTGGGMNPIVFRGNIAPTFTNDNIFEITGQKSVAGDSLFVENFVVAKHPRIGQSGSKGVVWH